MSGVTSVTTLVLFVGIMFSLSIIIPAFLQYTGESAQSQKSILESIEEAKNTDFNIISTSYNNSTDMVTLKIKNAGSSTIQISDIDLLLDGKYKKFGSAVEGASKRTVLNPDEQAKLTVNSQNKPNRSKLVTSIGISISAKL